MAISLYNRSGILVGQSTQIDNVPMPESDNTVKSGGVYSSIEDAPDKTVKIAQKNLFDKNSTVEGTINSSNGEIDSSDDYSVSDYIEIDTDYHYITAYCDKFGAYASDKSFISLETINNTAYYDQSLAFPANTKYIRLRCETDDIDNVICADVRYYTKNVTAGVVEIGYSEEAMSSSPGSIDQFAKANPMLMVKSGNLFDWRKDFVQVTTRTVGGGLSNTGSFVYKNNTVSSDTELEQNTDFSIDTYFPVVNGEMIVCNFYVGVVAFYKSDKTFISVEQNREAYQGIAAPENSAYARIMLYGTSDQTSKNIHSLEQIKDIIVFAVSVVGSNDLLPNHQYLIEHFQIDGSFISPNYLEKVHPSMQESDFLSAMKCMAIREVNARDHAYRFGNFNMWVMEDTKGWNNVQRMLMDCGIDFCGFEECVTIKSTSYHKGIAEFLHSWQFPYGFYTNWTDGETAIDKSFVSRFQVLSSTKHEFTSAGSSASYLNCVIQLPRYMDVYEPFRTLSVYVVHFPITTSEAKVAVATELLDVIAEDTSDFVIILGDTNDFGTTDETKDYWVTLEAGGFMPVIPITTKTITQDEGLSTLAGNCIDQFLVSSNIEAIGYNVINTKDKYFITDGAETSATDYQPALSDHDFVYCDLRFKYDEQRSNYPQSE